MQLHLVPLTNDGNRWRLECFPPQSWKSSHFPIKMCWSRGVGYSTGKHSWLEMRDKRQPGKNKLCLRKFRNNMVMVNVSALVWVSMHFWGCAPSYPNTGALLPVLAIHANAKHAKNVYRPCDSSGYVNTPMPNLFSRSSPENHLLSSFPFPPPRVNTEQHVHPPPRDSPRTHFKADLSLLASWASRQRLCSDFGTASPPSPRLWSPGIFPNIETIVAFHLQQT